ncbi:hypothetical protein pipiens_012193, partial [Culex pipiens pipiens]
MQFLRAKRATNRNTETEETGDIDEFRINSSKYLTFIEKLRAKLTQPSVKYGSIRLTKSDNGITKVILKSGSTKVPFIFRNSDLYIVGFVLGSGPTAVFWTDHAVFETLSSQLTGNKLPTRHEWRTVLGDVTVKTLSITLVYDDINKYNNWNVPINKMGKSLEQLAMIGDGSGKVAIVEKNIMPFVVAFSEAIRFKVICKAVQDVFTKDGGTFNMKSNALNPAGAGGPDQRRKTAYDYEWLVQHWGQISDRVKPCYDGKVTSPFNFHGEELWLGKEQLGQLLSVAMASSFTPRTKRDVPNWLNHHIPLEKQAGAVPNLLESSSSSANQPAVANRFELAGALQLISFGVLYLSGQQLKPTEYERALAPREAQAIAADLAAKINCVAKVESDFDEDMRMQRELYAGLMGEADMEQVML